MTHFAPLALTILSSFFQRPRKADLDCSTRTPRALGREPKLQPFATSKIKKQRGEDLPARCNALCKAGAEAKRSSTGYASSEITNAWILQSLAEGGPACFKPGEVLLVFQTMER